MKLSGKRQIKRHDLQNRAGDIWCWRRELRTRGRHYGPISHCGSFTTTGPPHTYSTAPNVDRRTVTNRAGQQFDLQAQIIGSLRCVTTENVVVYKPKFHLLRYVRTRYARRVMSRARRDERVALVVRVTLCMFHSGGRRRSSSARVYKFSLLCSGFASISGTTSVKS